MPKDSSDKIYSDIWHEEAEKDNPFAAKKCFCHGYDVFGEVISKAGYIEYLYLLFTGQRPNHVQIKLLETVAVSVSNPGPRDLSVRAAMNGGVGGSTAAACLSAALAVGAGQHGGAREIFHCVQRWHDCGNDLSLWPSWYFSLLSDERADIWPKLEHPPGFDPHAKRHSQPSLQLLNRLLDISPSGCLKLLKTNLDMIEQDSQLPIALNTVIASAFYEISLSAEQSEMLFLLLRLPGAAVHSLEQSQTGWRKYPFFKSGLKLENDPKNQLNNSEVNP